MYRIISHKSVNIPFTGSERIYFDVEIFKCPRLTTDATEKFNQIIGLIHCLFIYHLHLSERNEVQGQQASRRKIQKGDDEP